MKYLTKQLKFVLFSLISFFLIGCGSSLPIKEAPPIPRFISDGKTNSFINGQPTIVVSQDGLEVEAIFMGFDVVEKSLKFLFKATNKSPKDKLIEIEKIQAKLFIHDANNSTASQKLSEIFIGAVDPIKRQSKYDEQIEIIKNEKLENEDTLGSFIDIATEDTPAKKERVKRREEKESQYLSKIALIEKSKKNFISEALLSNRLLPGTSIQGIIFFHDQKLSEILPTSEKLVIEFNLERMIKLPFRTEVKPLTNKM